MKVFISYSWDSEHHKKWVQELAEQIADSDNAIEVIYDRIGMDHQVDRNRFMEKGIFESDVVLAVITSAYTVKANQRIGGVGRETAMAAERHWADLDRSSRTRILAVRRETGVQPPNYLRANLYFDFSDDTRYKQSLQELQEELGRISASATMPEASRLQLSDPANLESDRDKFSFTRTEDLIAGFYKQRTPLLRERHFSAARRVKYELWMVETPHSQLLLVLSPSITIRHTLEDLTEKIQTLPSQARELRVLTVLRPTAPTPGYIAAQLLELGFNFQVTELTFKDYLARFCIQPETLRVATPFKEPFYIDQALYQTEVHADTTLGPAKQYFLNNLLLPNSAPTSLLVASGGAGKTTLLRGLASDIEETGKTKVLLIEVDILKTLPRDQLRRAHVASLYDLYQLYATALASDGTIGADQIGRPTSERGLFDLLLISGSVLILIDGIDELLSLMQSNFELIRFIESINELNSELGQTRVVLASREDAVATTVASMRKHGVPIYSLKGFTEPEVTDYTRKRFSRRSKEHREATIERVVANVRTVSEALSGISVVLPFFVDVLCELEEDAKGNDAIRIGAAVAERLAGADYPHNNTVVDLLVFTILDRERERQGWNPTVGGLVEVFKELSSFYSGVCTLDYFSQAVETFLLTSGSNATEIFIKNPLLRLDKGHVSYKYDFLNFYFLSLWLIEKIENSTINDLTIKHLARYAVGQGSVFDDLSRFYGARTRSQVVEKLAAIYGALKKKVLPNGDYQIIEMTKSACSAIVQLLSNTLTKGMSRSTFSTILFSVVGGDRIGDRDRVSNLYIQGEFPVLSFVDRDVWNSELNGYEAFTRCRFENCKFYYSNFIGIHGDNRSPMFSKELFDMPSCNLGSLSTLFDRSWASDAAMLSVDEIKKFFRYFFVGGGFVRKLPSDLYDFSRPGLKEEVIDVLVREKILVENHAHSQLMYEVSSSHARQIQKFVNENNMSKQLRSIFKPYLEARSLS